MDIREFDYVVIGSGAGGAATAYTLAEAGEDVALLEEGRRITQPDFKEDFFSAMTTLFRDSGMTLAKGRSVLPILQGKAVGGTTVMNGAIVHPMPEKIYGLWQKNIQNLPSYEDLEISSIYFEKLLRIKDSMDRDPSLPIWKTLDHMGWNAQPMRRNAPGCQKTGRCLQGCPSGGKWSMERSLIPWAEAKGLTLIADTKAIGFLKKGRRVFAIKTNNRNFPIIHVKKAIFLSAGVIHSAELLRLSGFSLPMTGKNFKAHLSAGIVAKFDSNTRGIFGDPQGIEVMQFEKAKFATQLLPPEMFFSRTPLVGEELRHALAHPQNYAAWMASIPSSASGDVRFGWIGKSVRFDPTDADLETTRFALARMSEMLFALGAREIYPAISGNSTLPTILRSPDDIRKLESIPLNPKSFLLTLGHLFGSCSMGNNVENGVVDGNLKVFGLDNLLIHDASVFPTPIGVNPQHAIMSLARASTLRFLN